MHLSVTFASIFLAGFLAIAPAQAATVFSSGPSDDFHGYELTERWGADDFEFVDSGPLVSVRFWASDRGNWDGTLQYQIMQDDNGSPGAPFASGLGVDVQRTATGQPHAGGTEYEYTFDFAAPIDVLGGTRYWIGLHMKQDFSQSGAMNEVYWSRTTNIFGEQHHSTGRYNATPPWFADGAYSAFEITQVPEPSTWALLAIAVPFLIYRRAKRRT